MKLSPRDIDKLILHQAGFLAQKRLARGVRLNFPESVALIATVILEHIRDGKRVAELMDLGRRILGRREVMPGVPEMVNEVQVEGTFPDGTKLVTVHSPISLDRGDFALALYGSFLPVPAESLFSDADDDIETAAIPPTPGAVFVKSGVIELFAGRERKTLDVTNTGDRPIQVGSHFPFAETNRALTFDRVSTMHMHLDVAAGTAVRFEPGETKRITLVALPDAPPNPRSEKDAP